MYYRQPRYFNEFKCIGGECIATCCYGWRIDWTTEEIDKVKNAEGISPELKGLVEKTFITLKDDSERCAVEFDERNKCPCVTEEGLCRIQKELGAEYLSYTCTSYPRHTIATGKIYYRSCDSSCPEIIKKILNDEHSTDLINTPKKDVVKHVNVQNNPEVKRKYPEIQYCTELLEFFHELISDKKIPVETAIILGALAAQKLTEIVAIKEYDRIPEALKAFRKQFHNAEQLKAIENIKPNYYLKFGFLSELIEKVVENGATALLHDETGTLNIDLYNRGEQGLREALKGREFFLRNLALNLLFEFAVPFKFEEKTILENYGLFVAAFGLLKLNLIAVCSTEKGITMRTHGQEFVYHGDDKIVGMTAIICRGICQNSNKAKMVIGLLNDNKFTTPAYLALLVK